MIFHYKGENPQFNETFEFEIAFPELALIRFVVLDDDSLDYDFIGQYTLPFECIQPGDYLDHSKLNRGDMYRSLGYRHVHLYTIGGDLIANAYLFVHIVISSKSLAVVSIQSSLCRILHVRLFVETSANPLEISSFVYSSKITRRFLSNCLSKTNR